MKSNLLIVHTSKKKYNEILEEYSKIDEKYCFVLSRSNYYFWQYGNNKSLSQEDKTRYFEYSKNCDKLLSIMNEKFIMMQGEIENITKIHDEAAEKLKEKSIKIKLFREVSSGGSEPQRNTEEDPQRNLLFEKMLDEMIEEESEEDSLETSEESDEYSQDIDAI
jgi:hypothetical protein